MGLQGRLADIEHQLRRSRHLWKGRQGQALEAAQSPGPLREGWSTSSWWMSLSGSWKPWSRPSLRDEALMAQQVSPTPAHLPSSGHGALGRLWPSAARLAPTLPRAGGNVSWRSLLHHLDLLRIGRPPRTYNRPWVKTEAVLLPSAPPALNHGWGPRVPDHAGPRALELGGCNRGFAADPCALALFRRQPVTLFHLSIVTGLPSGVPSEDLICFELPPRAFRPTTPMCSKHAVRTDHQSLRRKNPSSCWTPMPVAWSLRPAATGPQKRRNTPTDQTPVGWAGRWSPAPYLRCHRGDDSEPTALLPARRSSRPFDQDKLALMLCSNGCEDLRANMGYDPRVAVHHRDGFERLVACCPHPRRNWCSSPPMS